MITKLFIFSLKKTVPNAEEIKTYKVEVTGLEPLEITKITRKTKKTNLNCCKI